MERSRFVYALVTAAMVLLAAPGIQSRQPQEAGQAFRTFQEHVAQFVALRHELARSVPAVKVGNAVAILEAGEALRAAIREARRAAVQGDIFTPESHPAFREVLETALREHDVDVAGLLLDMAEHATPGAPAPAINERLFWGLGAAIPPCALAALPPLPRELQYRLSGRDLLLIDLDTELVLDILPAALPRATPH